MHENQKAHTVKIFTEVAPKYEFLNSLLTAGRDRYWRETMLSVSEAALGKKPDAVLDLATGTGDVPRMMSLRWPQAKITGTDPTAAMLSVAHQKAHDDKSKRFSKIEWKSGLAEKIEIADESVNIITIAFGFRNVSESERQLAIHEAFRVLKPGGVYAILELGLPEPGTKQKIYKTLLSHGMPMIAGILAPKGPYKYLAQSILDFPAPETIKRMLAKGGFTPFAPRPLSLGMCWLYIGKKPLAN